MTSALPEGSLKSSEREAGRRFMRAELRVYRANLHSLVQENLAIEEGFREIIMLATFQDNFPDVTTVLTVMQTNSGSTIIG
jgi:hypothetical protein